ncbi:MAG: ABC-2 type transporter [Parcubacteria group bacterium Gr01-1014_8]|nr:MAG: ABC-2 type transporter [Parcubacteria group bacterium Gr01-1014_8]
MYLFRGSPTRYVQLFVWITVDIVLWGFITKYFTESVGAEFSFVTTLLGAVILWDILSRAHQGTTMPFLEDVWSRNFLNIFATPLKLPEYLLGFIMTSLFTTGLVVVAISLFAAVVFDYSLFSLGIYLAPFLGILFLFGAALGILGIGLVLRFGPPAEWFTWPLAAVLSPFAGVFYPISTLPDWMQTVAYLLPPAYVFEGMRGVILTGVISGGSLVKGFVLACVYVLLMYALFTYMYRIAIRNGLIARYSAEGP